MKSNSSFIILTLMLLSSFTAVAEDWPMWRCDIGHTGTTSHELPKELSLQWMRRLPPIDRAWPADDRLEFDVAYEPIVAGSTLYIASPMNDALMAFDTDSGAEKWRFYASGPFRFAPAIADGFIYAGSDDGVLYCLDANTGQLKWHYTAALSDRKVLGNTRIISVWPVRGAPVVAEGVVYFGAGIWPFEGVSVYALDATTGAPIWINDNCDVKFMMQPHHSPSFSGLAPQGYLAISGDRLLVPNGRAPAACLDRKSGRLLYYDMDANNRFGDYRVSVDTGIYVNPGALYQLDSGANLGAFPATVAFWDNHIIGLDRDNFRAFKCDQIQSKAFKDDRGNARLKWEAAPEWTCDTTATDFIVADKRIYAARPGALFAMEIPRGKSDPKPVWEVAVEGNPVRIIAANDRLFATTLEGGIYCFGKGKSEAPALPATDNKPPQLDTTGAGALADIFKGVGVADTGGYALLLGTYPVDMPATIAAASQFHVVALGKPDVLDAARRKLDSAGLYGERIALMDTTLATLPPYFASFAVVADATPEWASDVNEVKALYERLRPYGGVAVMPADVFEELKKSVGNAGLSGAEVGTFDKVSFLRRGGPLPSSANWTHQYADSANTVVSRDALVRAPLGLLWFGGSSNTDILPRHGHGPAEHVVDGRLFIEGPDMIRALDVYTGRVLWQTSLPEIGKAYDNTSHQPGANAIGSNYVSVSDGIYVAYGDKCLRLDPATGKTVSEFTLPVPDGANEAPDFGYIGVYEDVLVAGSGPLRYDEEIKGQTWNAVASKRVVALDRHSGTPLWTVTADAAFRHNAIALAAGKVMCIDRATDELRDKLARRGIDMPQSGRLLALDVHTGKEIWRTETDVYGTWLGYSEKHDILLQAGRASRDSLKDEVNDRMTTYKGTDGSVIWDRKVSYSAPCMLHEDTIIAQEKFFSLLTGETISRANPLTGATLDMTWLRQHGCNSAIACLNLVTFRSAAAGFFDLANDGGTGNIGGFKSGCTSNLIAANGVLNAPDYTRTCTCSYQNQTSLALVHTPGVEMWTYNAFPAGDERVMRVGINFGAPGDHRDDKSTLWLDYPSVGGSSPDIPVAVEPETPQVYRYHSLRVNGDGPAFVSASGVKGLRKVTLTLDKNAGQTSPYTVRLVFAEPDQLQKGGRTFDVSVQGKPVLNGFDIASEAGGPMRTVVKEFPGIQVRDTLEITMTPKTNETILCGIEAIAE